MATPVCSIATGAGYLRYALVSGPEYGYYNLAMFFAECNPPNECLRVRILHVYAG
jgi:pyruvate formate lyase activating enzyme